MMWLRNSLLPQRVLRNIPLELKRYDYSPSDGLLLCAIGLRDWAALIESCNDYV